MFRRSLTANMALPSVTQAGGLYTVSTSNVAQPGEAYTQAAAGGTFGLLRQTVVRDVGLGTSRQIQFALRLTSNVDHRDNID